MGSQISDAKCPPGKYSKAAGFVTSQPNCEACAAGFFKATWTSSTEADSCTAHTKCQMGEYTKTSGSATTQPKCELCATGFFKAVTSKTSTKTDSCSAQTKCPPGKYNTAIGSTTAQPQCHACAVRLHKAFTSENSNCITAKFSVVKNKKTKKRNGSDNPYTQYNTQDAEYVPQFGFSFKEVVIAKFADGVSRPTDLEFHPERADELWIANRATDSITIVHNTGSKTQSSETRLDVNRDHFLERVSAISFGSYHLEFDWQWGSAQESLNTYDGWRKPNYFMGPALWPSSLDHFAVENQNNEGGLLGSHLDMLHESPYGVGIAHDHDNVYWYNDGYYEELVRYDFKMDHDTGGHDHSDGVVHRYSEVKLKHLYGTPGHMVVDKKTGILYISDAGANRVIWVNTDDATHRSEDIMNDKSRRERLAEYSRISGVEWGVLVEGLNTPCGIALSKDQSSKCESLPIQHQHKCDGGQLFVSLNGDNSIVSYSLSSDGKSAYEVGTLVTSASSIMGIEIGPNGHLYYVDNGRNKVFSKVVRVDPVLDEDGDGYDNIDYNQWWNHGIIHWKDKFPNDPREWEDTDLDGIGNNADLNAGTTTGITTTRTTTIRTTTGTTTIGTITTTTTTGTTTTRTTTTTTTATGTTTATTGTTIGTTTPATTARCEDWCASNAKPWTKKCSWPACAACSSCSRTTMGTATGTTASCEGWCASRNKPWAAKCTWRRCAGCSLCSGTTTRTTTGTIPPCESWCASKNKPWTMKCTWPSCAGCSSCSAQLALTSKMVNNGCSSCSSFKQSGTVSCCAPGGSWFNKCGRAGDSRYDHTWSDGIRVCDRFARASSREEAARGMSRHKIAFVQPQNVTQPPKASSTQDITRSQDANGPWSKHSTDTVDFKGRVELAKIAVCVSFLLIMFHIPI